MALEMFGKTVKQLKQERTMAKSAFTKQANFLSRGARHMTEVELQEEFKKLTTEARDVSGTNEYRAGILADMEDQDEVELDKQQLFVKCQTMNWKIQQQKEID